MDPKDKGMVVNDKEKESLFNKPRDNKLTDSGSSHKKRGGKKKEAHQEDHILRQRHLLFFTKGQRR
jgi:hypothetical protein